MDAEPFVRIEDAARFLGVKCSWLYEQCRLGRIPSYKMRKYRRFRLSELEQWVKDRGNGAPMVPSRGLGGFPARSPQS